MEPRFWCLEPLPAKRLPGELMVGARAGVVEAAAGTDIAAAEAAVTERVDPVAAA